MDIARPDLKKRRKKLRVAVIGLTALGLVVTAMAAISYSSAAPSVPAADLMIGTVERGSFERTVRGPGKLVPSQMRWVTARSDATVERLLVRPGAAVTADTPIVELANPDVIDRFQGARLAHAASADDHRALSSRLQSDLLELESEAAAINAELEGARVDEEAGRMGLEKGVLSAVEYKKRKIALEQLGQRVKIARQRVIQSHTAMRSQLVASQARLAQLANTLELRRLEVDALSIRAGLDGVVQQLGVGEGERVTAGQNLARVAREGSLIAELRIPESYAADLQAGQTVDLVLGRSHVSGRVRRVNPAVERGAVLVEVDPVGALPAGSRPEQSMDGVVTIERLANALSVGRPVNSVPFTQAGVFRLASGGEAKRVNVRFGTESTNRIQVLQGLKEGDRIILSDTGKFDGVAKLTVE